MICVCRQNADQKFKLVMVLEQEFEPDIPNLKFDTQWQRICKKKWTQDGIVCWEFWYLKKGLD